MPDGPIKKIVYAIGNDTERINKTKLLPEAPIGNAECQLIRVGSGNNVQAACGGKCHVGQLCHLRQFDLNGFTNVSCACSDEDITN